MGADVCRRAPTDVAGRPARKALGTTVGNESEVPIYMQWRARKLFISVSAQTAEQRSHTRAHSLVSLRVRVR